MTYKPYKPESFWPNSIPACYFDDKGKWIVPLEWEDYYVRKWVWKRDRKVSLEGYKLKYLENYEKTHGKTTHWMDEKGNLRPLYLIR